MFINANNVSSTFCQSPSPRLSFYLSTIETKPEVFVISRDSDFRMLYYCICSMIQYHKNIILFFAGKDTHFPRNRQTKIFFLTMMYEKSRTVAVRDSPLAFYSIDLIIFSINPISSFPNPYFSYSCSSISPMLLLQSMSLFDGKYLNGKEKWRKTCFVFGKSVSLQIINCMILADCYLQSAFLIKSTTLISH